MKNEKCNTVGTVPKYNRIAETICIFERHLLFIFNKLKSHKYHTVRTVQTSIRKTVVKEAKWIPLTHIYITTHFHGLVQTLKKVNGVQDCFHMFLLIFIWCCLAV